MLLLTLTLIWPATSRSFPDPFSSGMTGAWHSYLGHPFWARQENELNKQRLLWSSVLSHRRSEFPVKQILKQIPVKQEFGQRRNRLWHNFSTLGRRHPWSQAFTQQKFNPEITSKDMFKLKEKKKELTDGCNWKTYSKWDQLYLCILDCEAFSLGLDSTSTIK